MVLGASLGEAGIDPQTVQAELPAAERDSKAARVKRNAFLKERGRPFLP